MWKLATLGTFAMLIGCSGAGIDPAFTHPAADAGVPEGTQTAPDAGPSVTSDAPSPPAPGEDAGEVVAVDAGTLDAATPAVDAAPTADDAAVLADAGSPAPDADTYAAPAACVATPYNSGEMPSACATGTTWGCATKESDGGPANYGGYCGQYSSGTFTLVYADGGLLSVGNGGTGVLVCCPAGVPGPT